MSNQPGEVKSFLVHGCRVGLFAVVVCCELSCGEVGTIYALVSKCQQFNELPPR
jgi:hypothetical protein